MSVTYHQQLTSYVDGVTAESIIRQTREAWDRTCSLVRLEKIFELHEYLFTRMFRYILVSAVERFHYFVDLKPVSKTMDSCQLLSSEANWPGSTLLSKRIYMRFYGSRYGFRCHRENEGFIFFYSWDAIIG